MFVLYFFSLLRLTYFFSGGEKRSRSERELAEKATLVQWIESNRNRNTKKSYATYTKQYLSYVQSSGLPANSDVTLASFMKAAFDRGLGRQTVTKTIPAAVAGLFRFEDESCISNSALVQQTKKVVSENTPGSTQKLPLKLHQLVEIAKGLKFRRCEEPVYDVFHDTGDAERERSGEFGISKCFYPGVKR